MINRLRDVQIALFVLLIAKPALAQSMVDPEAALQALGVLAYGPGAKILITMICSYLAFWGLGHERLWATLTGILGGVAYFAVGLILGRMGVV